MRVVHPAPPLALALLLLAAAQGDRAAAALSGPSTSTAAWMADPAEPPRDRAAKLLREMTFDEKVALLHGSRLSRQKECGECPYGDPRKKKYNQCYTGNAGIECSTGVPSRHG
jgi:hypothetical protein